MSIFHSRLKELKDSSDLTQAKIAEQLGITPQAFSYIVNGREPNYELLTRIALFFQVSTDWLLGLTDVKSLSADVKSACQYTGLSEKAAQALHEDKKDLFHYGCVQTANDLLEADGRYLLSLLFRIFHGEIIKPDNVVIGLACDGDEQAQQLTEDSIIRIFLEDIEDAILSMRKQLRRKNYEGPIPKDNP